MSPNCIGCVQSISDGYRDALVKASQRWCWCKQEELPGNCAKCIAEVALRETKEGK